MTNLPEKIIFAEDDNAAVYRTDLKGWVSAAGHYYREDERLARYDGSTHTHCIDCGVTTPKSRARCDSCYKKINIKKYYDMPVGEFTDGWLYCADADEYFRDYCDLVDHYESNELDLSLARPIICEPVYPSQIDPNEYYQDELPEDIEVPEYVQEAFDVLNEALRRCTEPLSWQPGKYRFDFNPTDINNIRINN